MKSKFGMDNPSNALRQFRQNYLQIFAKKNITFDENNSELEEKILKRFENRFHEQIKT